MARKIIIDCDPGHDDIMAIFVAMAHPEQLEILGYATVCGNNLVDKVTDNLCKVLTAIRCDAVVAKGYSAPLVLDPEPQPLGHGESGLDGPVLPESKIELYPGHALEFYLKTLEESQEKITIVALAPLTNIAMLLKTYPHLKEKIECITLMGGAISKGNILPKAEFNIYGDPHAAKVVFESGIPLIMSGTEVCQDCSIKHDEIDALKGKGELHDLVHDILQFFSLYSRRMKADRSPMFDVAPVMHLLHPEFFTGKKAPVYIEVDGKYTRGMTVVDEREGLPEERCNAEVLLTCDNEKLMEVFKQSLDRLEKEMA